MPDRVVVRNLRTGKEYPLTGEEWAAIQKKGWASRYEVVRETSLPRDRKVTYLPKEIKQAANAAAKVAGEQKENPAPGARQ